MKRTALVTGATGGIGRAICEAFAKDGCNIIMHTFSKEEEAKSLCKELSKKYGTEFFCVKGDFTKNEEIKALAEKALSFSDVDILVNNAGIAYQGLFQFVDEKKSREIFQINIESAVSLTKYILPKMIQNHKGKIINISSMWGVVGASCEVHYSTAKSAMIGFTKALAKEVGRSGITVNCIAPGLIDTKMNSRLSKEDIDDIIEQTPLYKIGTPKDIANTAVFLASEKAEFITGQTITVDGGLTL